MNKYSPSILNHYIIASLAHSPLIECVPNFSEGQDPKVIQAIRTAIESVPEVQLLHVDPGYDAHRTVMTFAGPPAQVIEAAFQAIKTASIHIDMNQHQGTHPRMGATDVCPLIPIRHISMEEVVEWSLRLAKRVGKELGIPIYLYERSAQFSHRKNLAHIRKGEYEGLKQKLQDPKWKPDFGPHDGHPSAGATVLGARPFLIAYNVNLDTKSVDMAQWIAQKVRESGYLQRTDDSLNGPIKRDTNGKATRIPGLRKSLKAIGWYIDEYDCAQVSMNLTNIAHTNMHEAFEACKQIAQQLGTEVTGSELIGMAPLSCFLTAGRFYAQGRELSEKEQVALTIERLGLAELRSFDPMEKVLEYRLFDK
ncbi:MAG: glutamate formimidoyltransferase [Bacteroidota bacterium]